ncbi:MAG: Malate Na(+) symporter [Verrucomicrobia bacterium]|nr:Malate Na(+) symporter [Verrucomicrobiota bacterium]
MERRIGVLPLPVYFVLLAVIIWFACAPGKFPGEICMMMTVLAVGGFTCGELGKHLPVLRHFGAAAIFATFIPSFLAYQKILPAPLVTSITDFTKGTNFLYLFIAAVIVGSILGMDRTVLIRGFVRIFVPIAVGSILAALVGVGVGTLLGLGSWHTLFYLVTPVMAGGVGEGAIPLSTGYAEILHLKQGDVFAEVLPPVMFGSLVAILLSGGLNYLGRKYPRLTGNGKIQPGEQDELDPAKDEISGHMDVSHVAAAGSLAISFYVVGMFLASYFSKYQVVVPAALSMLALALVAKLTHSVPPKLQAGAQLVYKFFASAVTYPLLFAIGVAMTPWDKLIAAFAPANLVTIFATVATMVTTGFFIARWIKLYPIETAIISACRCGQGGTGDVAILTASNRMQLMPFAQIATRIGGLITVTLALITLRAVS